MADAVEAAGQKSDAGFDDRTSTGLGLGRGGGGKQRNQPQRGSGETKPDYAAALSVPVIKALGSWLSQR